MNDIFSLYKALHMLSVIRHSVNEGICAPKICACVNEIFHVCYTKSVIQSFTAGNERWIVRENKEDK